MQYVPKAWTTWTMWQFSSSGGVIPSRRVDCNLRDPSMLKSHPTPVVEDPVSNACPCPWADPVDPEGLLYPHYEWDPPFFRAWYKAPIDGDFGQTPGPLGLPYVEIDTTGWLAGHAKSRGPFVTEDWTKVCVYRDDGVALVYPTGQHRPAPAPPVIDLAGISRSTLRDLKGLLPS
jgi:hypothetical protein